MQIPTLDLTVQFETIADELRAAVLDVLESCRYVMGPKVEELEEKIAAYVGTEHAIGVSSGTDALLVSLMALDVGPGDVVVTSTYSFFATAGAVARTGAEPAFVDIDPDTFNMDPAALREWFSQNPERAKRAKAIIPVHLYGQCADMSPLLEVAREHGLPVIEDAAQAIGAKYPTGDGVKKAGSMGLAGCFSFFPSKNLGGIGDGGMVTTKDAAFAEKVRLLRNHGAERQYHHAMIGGNFRLDAIQAAALTVKLAHLDQWHSMRQENAAYYDAAFDFAGLKTPAVAHERGFHIYNQYILTVPDRRDELKAHLADKGIASAVYYPLPFHLQECFSGLGYKEGDCPNSEHAAKHCLALPIYPELTREMQDCVVEGIRSFYAE